MPPLICSDNTDECLFLPRQSNHLEVQCLSVFLSAGSYSDKFLSDALLASSMYIHTPFGSSFFGRTTVFNSTAAGQDAKLE